MAYELMNKQTKASDGQIVSTKIDIKQNDPYTIISREIDGDHSATSDKKAIELVLEQLNEETTPKSELKGSIRELQNNFSSSLKSIEEQEYGVETLFGTVDELISVIYEDIIPKITKQDDSPEPSEEESNSEQDEVVE